MEHEQSEMNKDDVLKLIKDEVKKVTAFRQWRKFDSVTDQFSPITGASGQIGFFGTSKIAQPTTSGGTSSFTANSGTAINDASTFDGYTLKQVVKALRNLGLLQ